MTPHLNPEDRWTVPDGPLPGLATPQVVAQRVGAWRRNRSYPGMGLSPRDLLAVKREQTVSVVLPARETATTIGPILDVLAPMSACGLLDEVVVVDAASADGTAAEAALHGARVLQESELLAEHGPALGKGDAMWRGVSATCGDVVIFLDADTEDFVDRFVCDLLWPILSDPAVHLVKGAFARPFRTESGAIVVNGGGRVTELAARPLLNLFAPELAGFAQPLAGEMAARRTFLEQIPFPVGYGIETSMLVDALHMCGLDALAEADLGTRQNRHQSLRSLSAMSYAVLVALSRRVPALGEIAATAGPLLLPDGPTVVAREVPVLERPPLVSLRSTEAGFAA